MIEFKRREHFSKVYEIESLAQSRLDKIEHYRCNAQCFKTKEEWEAVKAEIEALEQIISKADELFDLMDDYCENYSK